MIAAPDSSERNQSERNRMEKPAALAGLRVLDRADYRASLCSRLMADMAPM
jgi:hypothetical protein